MKIRTRFAPSPTGYIHLGNAWVAFLNWLWTRQHRGTIVLRIEDIDRQRCRPEYVQALMEDLAWLGLDWDEGPGNRYAYGSAVQSERLSFYQAIFKRWKDEGTVYPCYCTRARLRQIASAPHPGEEAPAYDGRCRNLTEEERRKETKPPSWRFRMETTPVRFTDLLCGPQEMVLHAGADDFVLLRADGMIAYQLAASADDGAMGITHVFRGRDLLTSTADQLCLLQKLGYPAPVYAHLPLLADENGARLSKRQHGITIRDLREAGMTAASVIGRLLFWAGAVPKGTAITAEEALRTIAFEDCRALHAPEITAVPVL